MDSNCPRHESGHTTASKTAETRHSRTPTKTEKSCSKSRSKSRRKSKTRSKFRTRFKSRTRSQSRARSQSRTRLKSHSWSKSRSCSGGESRRPSEMHAPSPSTRQKKALQSKPVGKDVHAFSEQQWAPERNTTKVGPREHDKGQRESRVRYLSRMLEDIPESHTLYTDTARTREGYTSVVIDGTGSLQNSAAMRRTHAAHGEILGVALA
ncbi:hypothetical protein MRX96_010922 [Rhipicephalus microplus]